ncbi:MAG: alternative ribosome rescue aminoacyl-tRNA hydrolase ArfB [Nitriliruptoraceae bacterium]
MPTRSSPALKPQLPPRESGSDGDCQCNKKVVRMRGVRIAAGVVIPESELQITTVRSSGPGGQSVNTTDSKVELRWNISRSQVVSEADRHRLMDRLGSRISADGDLILRGQEYRSQARNRAAVRSRLAALVTEALEPDRPRRPTRPTKSSQRRRLESKRQRSETKRLRRRPDE